MITFFTQEENIQKLKEGHEGEVPDIFQNRFFNISIAGHKWVAPTGMKTNTLSARLLFKQADSTCFEEVLSTETLSGVSSPHFTKQARFAPLRMDNSQAYASFSVFRIDVVVNSIVYTSAEFTLAKLLWDRVFETQMDPYISTVFGKTDNGGGRIFVNIVLGGSIDFPLKTHRVFFSVRAHSSFWKRVAEAKVVLAISTTAEKGRWSRMYTSKRLQKPAWPNTSGDFARFSLDRNELMSFNRSNPIRVEIYGVRPGNEVLLGFFQCLFEELFYRETLEWRQTACSYLYTEIKFKKSQDPDAHSEVGMILGIFNRRKEILAAHQSLDMTKTSAPNKGKLFELHRFGKDGEDEWSGRLSAVSGLSEFGESVMTPSKEIVSFAEKRYGACWEEDSDSFE